MPDLLQVKALRKSFGAETVLHNCSLHLRPRQTLSVLGRSGSGKTTLLKIVAGLETADAGSVTLAGEDIGQTPAHLRGIVYLYQEALLFPHLDVFENIAFGLRLRKVPEAEIVTKVNAMLEELQIGDQARKAPEQLSGGQRQRVAFGRALIINPRVLLLDEPFGALDAQTRGEMQDFYRRIAAEFGITSIFVTHDLKEALLMGDELAVMERGQLKHYPDRAAFIRDEATGVAGEAKFWREIAEGLPGTFVREMRETD